MIKHMYRTGLASLRRPVTSRIGLKGYCLRSDDHSTARRSFAMSTPASQEKLEVTDPKSVKNPLGEGNYIK